MNCIREYSFAGKRTIVRVDFNVPFDKSGGVITDDSRIRRAVPTIRYICERGGRVILLSHMGRPKGKPIPELSLGRIVQTLSTLVGKHVQFVPECVGTEVETAVAGMKDGDILLLENVRFHAEDEGKLSAIDGETAEELAMRKSKMEEAQREFARALARSGDCFVNDAFSAAHRAHASTSYIAEFFPNDRMFGFLMEDELAALDQVLQKPKRPLTAIMGGAKVSDKLVLIENLLQRVNRLIVGGGMSYTFVRAMGGETGKSLCEEELVPMAKQLLARAKELGVELILPVDAVNSMRFEAGAPTQVSPIEKTPADLMGLDIGPRSVKLFSEAILSSGTVLWNGPMGVFEMEGFQEGTFAIAKALAEATRGGTYTLVGGGDSVAALKQSGQEQSVSYVSTGGGAMLEYLEGKNLPGVAAIRGE